MPAAIDGMKECSKCKEIKPVEEFSKNPPSTKSRDGYRSWCKECRKTEAQEKRDWINTFKQVPCTDCGRKYPPILMDFDHVPEKGIKIDIVMRLGKKKALEEIAKCEVVCPTCHRIRTVTRLGLLTKEDLDVISQL